VTPAAFGTMTLGDPVDETASFAILDRVVDHGVNFLDTANMYTGGRSEEIIGRWMRARGNRDRIVLASKVRYPVGGDPDSAGLSPVVVMREVHRSLRRLGTDFLDILYLHQPDAETPLEVTWRCLESLVDQGKVRAIGLSNFAAWQGAEAVWMTRSRGWTRPTVLQFLYNAISRAAESELWGMARAHDFGVCVFNPLAGGLLTGKYGTDEEARSGRLSHNEMYRKRYWDPRQRNAAAAMAVIAREHGRSPVELAIRFVADQPQVGVVLLGATTVEQIEQGLAAFRAAPLTDPERAACEEVWAELHGPVPPCHRGG
jgi:aryl-alcohol dehydrogenase-like predicted oxidoreductase